MPIAGSEPEEGRSSAHRWGLRAAVLLALAATIWWFGPRAAEVLAARFRAASRDSPAVALDRVGFVASPKWLRGEVLGAVARDLQPWLRGEVAILDDAAAAELLAGVRSVPWVRGADLERVFPDRLHLCLDVRRPVLAVQGPDEVTIACLDRDGIALPPVDVPGLPRTVLRPEGGPPPRQVVPGARFPDDRALAALTVGLEWLERLQPGLAACPPLLEVDANNLGERWIVGARHPEVRVVLRRTDGMSVVFAYGRPPGSTRPRVPVEVKAKVLQQVLAAHPGLAGLTGGDLRFQVRWQDWLLPRSGSDPAGPWGGAVPK